MVLNRPLSLLDCSAPVFLFLLSSLCLTAAYAFELHVDRVNMSLRCSYTQWGSLAGLRHTRNRASTLCLWLAYTYFLSTVHANSIATWWGLRAALIRDSVYLEGGSLNWGNWSDGSGSFPDTALDPDYLTGVFYKLDLSLAFNSSDPLRSLSKMSNNNTSGKPGYSSGSMFVDANGFVLFGGLANELVADNTSSGVTSAQLYPWPYDDSESAYPIDSISYSPTLAPPSSSNSSLWHRCCGSSASLPNGHLSFYFSGLISATGAAILLSPTDNGTTANFLANDMIVCNTTNLTNIACRSVTLPDFVKPRTEAALVWLPIGKQGSLILFGGVHMPADYFTQVSGQSPNNTFITDILIYDIDSEIWHLQPTLGTGQIPPPTAAFCTVLAVSKDQSSFNIYMYGGYDGTYLNANPYDDVWVLSLPSFAWIKVYDGSSSISHARQSQQCVSPYPNIMVTIGGSGGYGSPLSSPTGIDVFDLNELIWTSTYDPLNWSDYKVPKNLSNVIGGNENGGARLPVSGLDPAVASLFKILYKEKIPIYYPYAKKTLIQHIRNVPEWLRTIVGILAYLLLSSAAFSCVMLLWRRRYLKAAGLSGADLGPGHGLITWSHGLLGRRIELPIKSSSKDKIESLTIPYFDNVDSVSTRNRVSTDGNSNRSSRWSEQNSLFNEVELRTFIHPSRTD